MRNMGSIDMSIIFEKPEKRFLSGEMITGWLVIKPKRSITLKSVSVKIEGKAKTLWNESGYKNSKYSFESELSDLNDFKKRMNHSGSENYFEKKIILFGGKGNEKVLQAGERCFKFEMLLPKNIPSSFEGAYGHVRYKVKGKLDRPILKDCNVEAMFKVISLIDLNSTPEIEYPLVLKNRKRFLHGLSKSQPLSLVTEIDVRGFDLHLTVEVDNASDVDITAVKYELQRRVIFYSSHRSYFKSDNDIILIGVLDGTVPHNSSRTWTCKIRVPENTPPSFLKQCKIIDLDYRLQIRARPSGVHLSLETSMPIIIGTKPIISVTKDLQISQYTTGLATFSSEITTSRSGWPKSRHERYF